METRNRTKEDRRYLLYRVGAHTAWWSAFALTLLLTIERVERDAAAVPTKFEQISGIFIILAMGIAIALGSGLARMRLARTIMGVFEAGMKLGRFQDDQDPTHCHHDHEDGTDQ